jgi:hypothetical protein
MSLAGDRHTYLIELNQLMGSHPFSFLLTESPISIDINKQTRKKHTDITIEILILV